jgi:hypothetical protein
LKSLPAFFIPHFAMATTKALPPSISLNLLEMA